MNQVGGLGFQEPKQPTGRETHAQSAKMIHNQVGQWAFRDPEKAATDTGFAKRKHLSRILEKNLRVSERRKKGTEGGSKKVLGPLRSMETESYWSPRTMTFNGRYPVLLSRYSPNHQGG